MTNGIDSIQSINPMAYCRAFEAMDYDNQEWAQKICGAIPEIGIKKVEFVCGQTQLAVYSDSGRLSHFSLGTGGLISGQRRGVGSVPSSVAAHFYAGVCNVVNDEFGRRVGALSDLQLLQNLRRLSLDCEASPDTCLNGKLAAKVRAQSQTVLAPLVAGRELLHPPIRFAAPPEPKKIPDEPISCGTIALIGAALLFVAGIVFAASGKK